MPAKSSTYEGEFLAQFAHLTFGAIQHNRETNLITTPFLWQTRIVMSIGHHRLVGGIP